MGELDWDKVGEIFREHDEKERNPRWSYSGGSVGRGNVGMFIAGHLNQGVADAFIAALNNMQDRISTLEAENAALRTARREAEAETQHYVERAARHLDRIAALEEALGRAVNGLDQGYSLTWLQSMLEQANELLGTGFGRERFGDAFADRHVRRVLDVNPKLVTDATDDPAMIPTTSDEGKDSEEGQKDG